MRAILSAIEDSGLYQLMVFFFATYPVVTSVMWISTALFFIFRWEQFVLPMNSVNLPKVSVLIPAYNEEKVIEHALHAVCALHYPDFETVVVNDGSTDATLERVQPFVQAGKVRLINKLHNEGKAMALNDVLPCLNGEIILVLDADAEPDPMMLHYIVPHFTYARVAAVTGNPRVKNVNTFLCRLQLMEFCSIISLLRRSQRVWGRILTVSGVCAAFRKSALYDVNGFSPEIATEDIEITWKLQKRFWDVRFEPKAIVWMKVPATYGGLIKQRLRWAKGLMQVLHKHVDIMLNWKCRRMWPIFVESLFSTLWAACFVLLLLIWLLKLFVMPTLTVSFIPNIWGMMIATLCLLQLAVGMLVERHYDREIIRYFPYAVFYPLIYWTLMAVSTFLSLPHLFKQPSWQVSRWHSRRD